MTRERQPLTPRIASNYIAKKTDHSIYGKIVYLGASSTPNDWEEITEEEIIAPSTIEEEE